MQTRTTPETTEIYEYCRKVVKTRLWSKYSHLEDDVVQEAVMACLEALERFDPTRAAWTTYLHRPICRALCRVTRDDMRHSADELDTGVLSGTPGDWSTAERDARDALCDVLGAERCAQVWWLRLQGASIVECASAIGVSTGWLHAKLKEAAKAL